MTKRCQSLQFEQLEPKKMMTAQVVGDGCIAGDINLDGVFDETDLIQAYQNGHYEDNLESNSGWNEGDWNGDGEFDSSDLVMAFQAGRYVGKPKLSTGQNPINHLDVDGDGMTSPIDALLIHNEMNRHEDSRRAIRWEKLVDSAYYLDVNGDDYVSLADAQLVFNHLDGKPTGQDDSQNPADRFDVNDDGVRSPIDSLLIANELSRHDDRDHLSIEEAVDEISFLDVNGDGLISPVDAILVIDNL